MSAPRLTAEFWVKAYLARLRLAEIPAFVTARGDATAGAVVVKACKPQQDERFDLPTVGPRTLEVMGRVGARVLALEVGRALVIDVEEVSRQAERHGICVVGAFVR